MILQYRTKFRKVFVLFLITSIIPAIYFISLRNSLGSNNFNTFLLNPLLSLVMFPLAIVAYISYVWMHYLLAKGKGYSGWLTLLAVFNLIGLIILLLLPDRNKHLKT